MSAALYDRLKTVTTGTITTMLLKKGIRRCWMHGPMPLEGSGRRIIGPAFTMRFIPAREDLDSMALYQRNDSLHRRAIEECPANAVLVMSTGNDTRVSCMGDMMALRLKVRGVAGVVTDGGFRDSPGIRTTGLPCFQRESSGPATPITLHPVEFDAPIGCAGVAVYPGDIVVGDAEGVVVIPRHLAGEVADEAFAAVQYEEFVAAHLRRGRSIFGLFPATPESKAEYDRWVAAGRPSLDK